MVKKSIRRFAALSKLSDLERQFKKELAKAFLEYLETLSFSKRIQEMESILFETEIKRIMTLDQRLTPQEKKCLFLSSKGKGIKEIANLLKFKPRTAQFHRENAMRKLKTNSITKAIILGIKYNQFDSIS